MNPVLLLLWLLLARALAAVDINAASAAELESLPGIGPAKARAIVEYRERNGPFSSLEELDEVPGIGPATLRQLRGLVTVDGEAPAAPAPAGDGHGEAGAPVAAGRVDINAASAAELESLPGIGPAKARAIVEDREQNGPFGSCDDLVRVRGVGPATVAALRDLCVAGPAAAH